MGRKKLKLQLIVDGSSRKTTYKKRKAGILKKVSEIHTLCDVDTCAIIFSDIEDKPNVWPSKSEAHRVLERFKSMPKTKQGKYMLDQKIFLSQSLTKMALHMQKRLKRNKALDLESLLLECLEDKQIITKIESMEHIALMLSYVDGSLKKIAERNNFLDRSKNVQDDVEALESASDDEEEEEEEEDEEDYESDDSETT